MGSLKVTLGYNLTCQVDDFQSRQIDGKALKSAQTPVYLIMQIRTRLWDPLSWKSSFTDESWNRIPFHILEKPLNWVKLSYKLSTSAAQNAQFWHFELKSQPIWYFGKISKSWPFLTKSQMALNLAISLSNSRQVQQFWPKIAILAILVKFSYISKFLRIVQKFLRNLREILPENSLERNFEVSPERFLREISEISLRRNLRRNPRDFSYEKSAERFLWRNFSREFSGNLSKISWEKSGRFLRRDFSEISRDFSGNWPRVAKRRLLAKRSFVSLLRL